MNIIENIFSVIGKFHQQTRNLVLEEQDFQHVVHSYHVFKKCANFLFIVLSKLASKQYDQHLIALLISWNYNQFYKETIN